MPEIQAALSQGWIVFAANTEISIFHLVFRSSSSSSSSQAGQIHPQVSPLPCGGARSASLRKMFINFATSFGRLIGEQRNCAARFSI